MTTKLIGGFIYGDLFYAMAKHLVSTIIFNRDDEPNKLVALGERLGKH